ncbi:PucR-like helix-turn-helix protein [Nocardioides sp. J9]|uniref:PucR family transcriptional regulator n=1 Tax=Nocardioides sp. J9 TaxID=935844 RepID=UPI0011AA23F9|nr:helix-turn-helix domain-containing protein [Nocardioides sp. J9]TWG91548.1 PucR-like helix-turn-helix protein [Nocardioides sp. J9]
MSNDVLPSGIEPWLLAYVAEQAQPARVEEWSDQVTAGILREMPDARRFDGVVDLLQTAVRDHWVAFLADFAQPEQHFHLVDTAAELARIVAQQQIPAETLIQFYRVAQQEVWVYVREVTTKLSTDEVDRAELLVYFWNRAGVWLDKSIGASIEIYHAERNRVLAGAAAQRYESVKAILSGEVTDPRAASAALGGYPISVFHTAFVLSVDDPERAGSLESLASELVRVVGGNKPLLVKPGGRQLWLWVATRDALDLADLADAASGSAHDGIRVGVGSPEQGLRGFASSHAEAMGALEVTSSDRNWLATYVDVELPVLLGCSPEVDRFMERQLGPLLGDDESTERIRETVVAFLACGGSAEEAARTLVVHRNTVRYRLGQAEELLGRPVTKVSPDLAVALRHHVLFHQRAPRS